jgi:hypothetical protein
MMGLQGNTGWLARELPKYMNKINIIGMVTALITILLDFVALHFTHVENELMEDLAEAITGERPDFDN